MIDVHIVGHMVVEVAVVLPELEGYRDDKCCHMQAPLSSTRCEEYFEASGTGQSGGPEMVTQTCSANILHVNYAPFHSIL